MNGYSNSQQQQSQNGTPNASQSGTRHRRVPTLHETLPYTAFASILPFDARIVPIPDIAVPSYQPLDSNNPNQQHVNRTIASLNQQATEAERSDTTSDRLEQVLGDVRVLLNEVKVPDYKFRTPSLPFQPSATAQTNGISNHSAPKTGLDPFSKLVLGLTQIPYRYTTPTSPATNRGQNDCNGQPQQQQPPSAVSDTQTSAGHTVNGTANATLNAVVNGTGSGAISGAVNGPVHAAINGAVNGARLPNGHTKASQPHVPSSVRGPNGLQPQARQAVIQSSVRTSTGPQSQAGRAETRPLVPAVVLPSPSVKRKIQDSQSSLASDGSLTATPEARPGKRPNATSSATPRTPVVVIPSPSSSAPLQHTTEQEIDARFAEAPASQQVTSKKRKRKSEVDVKDTFDGRIQAEAHFNELEGLMSRIFEAEDELDSNASGMTSSRVQETFSSSFDRDEQSHALNGDTLSSLDAALQKVIKAGRFGEVPVEQLCHLQRLCMAGILRVPEIDLSLPEEAIEESPDAWNRRLSSCIDAVKAGKTLLRIMTAGRPESQLYSDDNLEELLKGMRYLLEGLVIPLAEKPIDASTAAAFSAKAGCKEALASLTTLCGRLWRLLGELVQQTDLLEDRINTIEYLSMQLVFVQNIAAEKDSHLGVQRVETLRRHAMDTIAKEFLRYPEQRTAVVEGLLSSLEKLPLSKQSARQFKIPGVNPIQPVSALVLQLIQTSAMATASNEKSLIADGDEQSSDDTSDSEVDSPSARRPSKKQKMPSKKQTEPADQEATSDKDKALYQLASTSQTLCHNAASIASHVIRYLVGRALKVNKSGEHSYRALLDLFVGDFLNVVHIPAWPGAAVLVQTLTATLFTIIDKEKSSAPDKNLAIGLLGQIGSTIALLRSDVTRAAEKGVNLVATTTQDFVQQCEDSLSGKSPEGILDLTGPHKLILDYLQLQSRDDLQVQSALSLTFATWSQRLVTAIKPAERDGDNDPLLLAAEWALTVVKDPQKLKEGLSDHEIADQEARCYHLLILLNMPFCRAFTRIVSILLSTMTAGQATSRTSALRSVVQLLDQDPTILDSSAVVAKMISCSQDPSPMVRDCALTLMDKCATLRPALDAQVSKNLIDMSFDVATGVRKRSLRLLKQTYLRHDVQDLRAAIADATLARLIDPEESVSDLATSIIEEIWLSPYHSMCSLNESLSSESRRTLEGHCCLVVATAQRSDEVTHMLEKLYRDCLKAINKNCVPNRAVCKAMVSTLYDFIIDNDQTVGRLSQKECLHTLAMFAKADPTLFTANNLVILRPYLENLSTTDDLLVYRSTIMIFRRVLPVLPPLQKGFLIEIQDVLFRSVQRLGQEELNEAAMCLWTINGVVQNIDRLMKLMISVLRALVSKRGQNLTSDDPDSKRVPRYLGLAGSFGKACDFEAHLIVFRKEFANLNFDSVSGLVIDVVAPLTNRENALPIQEAAIDAIGLVCQSWPRNYQKAKAMYVLQSSLRLKEPTLQRIVLSGLRAFYLDEDLRFKIAEEALTNVATNTKPDRLGKPITISDNDGAATANAQQYLPDILQIALNQLDELAVMATEILASISRQGLMHPKELIAAFVALETSPHPVIAKIAAEEHRTLHSKHESLLDREYIAAVERTYVYSRDAIGGTRDAICGTSSITSSGAPKLGILYDILKTGSITSRKKLLTGLCNRIEAGVKGVKDITSSIRLARFIIENLALLEFARVDELLHLLGAIDKVLDTTGNYVVQRVESTLGPGSRFTPDQYASAIAEAPFESINVDDLLGLRVQVIPMRMFCIARWYLKRAWGLQSIRTGKAKAAAKDVNKPPVRAANFNQSELLTRIETMLHDTVTLPDASSKTGQTLAAAKMVVVAYNSFLDDMSIETEARAASDEDDADGAARATTPSENGTEGSTLVGSAAPPSSQKGRKKRLSGSAANTPSKTGRPRGRPPLNRKKSSKAVTFDDDADGWD